MNEVKTYRYVDHVSRLFLWQKAVLLIPVWGLLAVPVLGVLLGSWAGDLGYLAVLVFFMGYFLQDILKTKIRIRNDHLDHGLHSFDLRNLASLALEYKSDQMLPNKVVLNFNDGQKYKLKISRLGAADTESLVKFIETRYPSTKVDPILRALSKCKRLAGTTALDTATKVEIPYQSRLLFKQLQQTFIKSTEDWTRGGPVLCFLLFSYIWLHFFTGLFCNFNYYKDMATLKWLQAGTNSLNAGINYTGANLSKSIWDLMGNPAANAAVCLSFIALATYLLRYALRPNVLMLDEKGISLLLRLGMFNFKLGQQDWSSIYRAYLQTRSKSSSLERSRIVLQGDLAKAAISINLSGLQNEHRTRLLKSINRLAPNCEIDPQLTEALMPKQERSYTELWLQTLSSAPERKNLEPLFPGQLLKNDRFEVIKRLGVGGQGLAYLCKDRVLAEEDPSAESHVVLKETILPLYVESSVKQQALQRFQQEAEILNAISSDRIVDLLDYFVEDHRGYLVLEHIDGKTLRQLVDEQGAVDQQHVLDLAIQMCEILEYLHRQGIIHRDFTPDNLILSTSGKLKLIDFNVARSADGEATTTIVGKHAFLPPEQFRGKPTFQSDIYAMGASLFFLLTGQDPQPISQSNPANENRTVSAALSRVVEQCTQLQASKRYADALQVREALLSLCDSEDVPNIINLKTEERVI